MGGRKALVRARLDRDLVDSFETLARSRGLTAGALLDQVVRDYVRVEGAREGAPAPNGKPATPSGKEVPQKHIEIYTDGGCRGNPGPGGWAAVIYEGSTPTQLSGAEQNTTNQRMEIKAVVEALRALRGSSVVKIHSDSAYVLNCMNQRWYLNWERNGWKTSGKKPVKNADLWRELLDAARAREVDWVKVEGHAGVPGNELCHRLVQLAINRGG